MSKKCFIGSELGCDGIDFNDKCEWVDDDIGCCTAPPFIMPEYMDENGWLKKEFEKLI